MLGEYFIPLVILVYLGALIGYGAWHSRRIRTQEDFAVAGRKLTAPVLVGTMLATWIGTGSLIGAAEETYRVGVTMVLMPVFSAIGLLVLAKVSTRIRRFEQITVQDIIEHRYNVAARVLSTVAIITAYLTILSYQYRAGGAVIHTIYPGMAEWCNANFAGLNEWLRANTAWTDSSWGSVFAMVFIIGYTVLGGLMSVAYTDVVNGVVMLIGILIALPFLFFGDAGGLAGIQETFAATPEKTQLFGSVGWIWAINLVLPGMMLLMGEANMYQRFFAAKNTRAALRAGWILVFVVIIVESAIAALAFVGSSIETGLPVERFGHVILITAKNHLPIAVGALILSAAVAIVVSTADSFLLVSANSFVRDVYHRFVHPHASGRTLVFASRLAVVFLGLAAFCASVFATKFLSVALWAYTVYGAAITPALLAAFFWNRATGAGAACAIGGATITTIVWKLSIQKLLADYAERLAESKGAFVDVVHTISELDAIVPALAVSLILLIGVSLMTPKPKREQWEPFAS